MSRVIGKGPFKLVVVQTEPHGKGPQAPATMGPATQKNRYIHTYVKYIFTYIHIRCVVGLLPRSDAFAFFFLAQWLKPTPTTGMWPMAT